MLLLCLQENCHICSGAVQQNAKRTAVPMARRRNAHTNTHTQSHPSTTVMESRVEINLSLSLKQLSRYKIFGTHDNRMQCRTGREVNEEKVACLAVCLPSL